MAAPAYQYSPITSSPRTFRVIRLLPTQKSGLPFPGLAKSTLRLELVEVDADAEPFYDALSYSWNVSGLKPPDRPVIIETLDGPRQLQVFEPLETALLQLVAHQTVTRPLFVDQICINQKDLEEKVVQVQLMRDIYARAVCTVVWLGPGSRATDEYFDFVRQVCEHGTLGRLMAQHVGLFQSIFRAVMDSEVRVTGVELEERDEVLSLLSLYSSRFPVTGMLDVFGRTWFTRLWIIQEACLAPTLVFVCGSQSLCFDCFRAGALFYSIYNTHWLANVKYTVSKKELRRRDNAYTLMKSPIRIFQERRAIHALGRRQSFYDLVLKYNVNDGQPKIGASLPEDRLFGVLGLASDLGLSKEVSIRYGETAKVYTEFAAMFVENNIDTLLFSQFPKVVQGLPSWVPDWSMDLAVPHGYATLAQPVFAAGGTVREEGPRFDADSERLTVRGLAVGRIAEVGKRTVLRDYNAPVVDQIDSRSLKYFFDEIHQVLGRMDQDSSLLPSLPVGIDRDLLAMRLSDFGLSAKHFSETLDASAATELQHALYTQASKWGQRLIDIEHNVQSFSITRIIQTVGVYPWYWFPASEVDVLYLCASKPQVAFRIFLQGASEFTCDLIGLGLASAAVQLYAHYSRLRRELSGMQLNADPERQAAVLRRVGLDPELSTGPQMSLYTDNVYKNRGQHIYRTTQGHMGVVPKRAQKGDFIVVLFGGSVPHVVRKHGHDDGEFLYIGEAYCDGVMDGELVTKEEAEMETFQLVSQ